MILRILEVIAMVVGVVYALLAILSMIYRLWNSRHMKWIPLFVVLLLPTAANAAGNEARCDELGANCICSEPMNTATWDNALNNIWFDPADTTTKECSTSGVVAGGALEDGSGFRYSAASSGEQITNLPAGHTNTYVLKVNDGGGGQFFGHKYSGSDPTARRAIRFYKYYSSNYDWVGGACLNSNKIAQGGWNGAGTGGPMMTETAGTWSFYDINTLYGWNQSVDCCSGPGPGESETGPSLSSLRGKWVRYEFILHNATTSGTTRFEWYMKNVTDNTPEIRLVDTSISNAQWTSTNASTLGFTTVMDEFSINMFRNGTCAGSAAFSHYLAAAWSSDAGQRIGAATEIEGGSSSPSIVIFLEWITGIMSISWHFRNQLLAALLAVVSVGGTVWGVTKGLTYNSAQKMAQVYLDYVHKEKQ